MAEDHPSQSKHVVIIGAGPAGLTAAYELCSRGFTAVVLESDETVGGISRTVNYKGYLFDIGGHRFFSKSEEVNQIWQSVLPGKFLERPRLSRILYRGKFFYYPLRLGNALGGLGLWEAIRIVASYLWARLRPSREETNFEQWVTNRFGNRLYQIFFKTYTEKVWGVPCTEIRAEWAAQRIKGLSLIQAVRNAVFGAGRTKVKSLIDKFHYPERGPGQMWEAMRDVVESKNCPVSMGRRVVEIVRDANAITHVITDGIRGREKFEGTHFISSMPIRELINAMVPAAPNEVIAAANELRYRDFLIVSLIIQREVFAPDNWIYVHEPGVRVGRIQNFKQWSPAMVPDPATCCVGMEYFVFEDDDLWSAPDDVLVTLATDEIVKLGLATRAEISDGTVVRMPKAYPMYDPGWGDRVELIRQWLGQSATNLQLIGRNGMHRYNNQDHSMLTALYAARNVIGGEFDLWTINADEDYHEESGGEAKPGTMPSSLRRPAYAEPPRIEPETKSNTARSEARKSKADVE